jgi:ribosome-associated toxin RatA of RatAB toxin-antitoxin module
MAIIKNEILINASVEKIWKVLADLEALEKYDPTVKKSILISSERTGIGAKRKVSMLDGKNWFDEKIIEFEPNLALTYQLTECSFPIKSLQHSYRFEQSGNETNVKQLMKYTVKFGLFGKLLDVLMIKKQSDAGIKKFFTGLKSYVESN